MSHTPLNAGPGFKAVLNTADFKFGSFLIAVALVALVACWDLRIGNAMSMGPGYLPRAICFLQLFLGALIILGAFRSGDVAVEADDTEAQPARVSPRAILTILGSVIFFGATIEQLGLVVAIGGLVVISCLGSRGIKPFLILAMVVGFSAIAALIFVVGLELNIPLWPTGFV